MKLEVMERMNDKELKNKGIIFISNRLIALRLAYNNLIVSEEYSQDYKEIKEMLEKRLKNNIDRLERLVKEMV